MRRRIERLCAAAAAVALGGCTSVLGFEDRHVDEHVVCEGGACACSAGFGDCDGDSRNGCETTTRDDAKNCGGCGIDCQGGDCEDGVCKPVTITTGELPGDVSSMAVVGDEVYFVIENSIYKVPTAGGDPVPVDSGETDPVIDLADDGESLVWMTPYGVSRLRPGAATAEQFNGEAGPFSNLVANDAAVAWMSKDGPVYRMNIQWNKDTTSGVIAELGDTIEPTTKNGRRACATQDDYTPSINIIDGENLIVSTIDAIGRLQLRRSAYCVFDYLREVVVLDEQGAYIPGFSGEAIDMAWSDLPPELGAVRAVYSGAIAYEDALTLYISVSFETNDNAGQGGASAPRDAAAIVKWKNGGWTVIEVAPGAAYLPLVHEDSDNFSSVVYWGSRRGIVKQASAITLPEGTPVLGVEPPSAP